MVKGIRKISSILIIGKGNSEYKNKQVIECNYIEEVENLYGANSQLTNAFKEAKEIGIDEIYLCNCFLFTDYIDFLKDINNYSFSFITPLFNFSETYKTNFSNEVYLCELYSNTLMNKMTQLIFTDKHASLYEDLESYLEESNSINDLFKSQAKEKLSYGDNMCFVLNNLKKYNFANVVLAGILIQSDLKEYPQKDVGDVVFDINNYDLFGQELIYYAYNQLTKTTIENFQNYRKEVDAEKFVPIHLIVQIISNSLDFSEFSGKLFTPYMQVKIEKEINEQMEYFLDKLIESYKVVNINYVKSENNKIIIYILISIKPYNSIEILDIKLEV